MWDRNRLYSHFHFLLYFSLSLSSLSKEAMSKMKSIDEAFEKQIAAFNAMHDRQSIASALAPEAAKMDEFKKTASESSFFSNKSVLVPVPPEVASMQAYDEESGHPEEEKEEVEIVFEPTTTGSTPIENKHEKTGNRSCWTATLVVLVVVALSVGLVVGLVVVKNPKAGNGAVPQATPVVPQEDTPTASPAPSFVPSASPTTEAQAIQEAIVALLSTHHPDAILDADALAWMVEYDTESAHYHDQAPHRVLQRYVLAVLALVTHKQQEGNLWVTDLGGRVNECFWPGVHCNNEDEIVGLDLQDMEMTGPLPEEVFWLTKLETFDASNNKLQGELPSSFGQASNLYSIDLAKNQFSGSLPISWANQTRLRFVRLDSNPDLQGPIPLEWRSLARLQTLTLEHTGLQGPMPTQICALEFLSTLTANCLSMIMPCPCCTECLM